MLAHLWFVTLHPFDDGNGRIARTVGDLLPSRADSSSQRFYSLSAQIQREHKAYYDFLERTQKGSLDVTAWLACFLAVLHRAIDQAQHTLDAVLARARFWQRFAETAMNARQVKLLNRLLDGIEGKLTTSKWAAIAKCSPDTALRDINDLLAHGALRKSSAGGAARATGRTKRRPRVDRGIQEAREGTRAIARTDRQPRMALMGAGLLAKMAHVGARSRASPLPQCRR